MEKEPKKEKYILYCGQDGNFQTRSMLIPVDFLPDYILEELQILRQYAKPFKIEDEQEEGQGQFIEQVLFINCIWDEDDNYGEFEESPYLQICHKLSGIADWGNSYYSPSEKEEWEKWISKSFFNVCSDGFNHIQNYQSMRHQTSYNGTPIEIVEGFLVLETKNGVWRPPMFDTVSEMRSQLYGQYGQFELPEA